MGHGDAMTHDPRKDAWEGHPNDSDAPRAGSAPARAAVAPVGGVKRRLLSIVLSLLVLFVASAYLSIWSNRAITDPDDQCQDSDSPWVARFVVCTIERK